MSSGEARRRSTFALMGIEGEAVDVGVYADERERERERERYSQMRTVDQMAEGDSERRTHTQT